jgi:hypothetical protein
MMKWLKKLLRLFALVLLIVLASVGIGIIGGAPAPVPNRKENGITITTEQPEEESIYDEENGITNIN